MKKEIEHAAHIPIRQQSWVGLMSAEDSVRCQIKKPMIICKLFCAG
jgi:hypothetical protein